MTRETDSSSKVFLNISDLFTSLFLSVSAAGIFHLLIVYFPERDKNRRSLRLLKDHLIVLDEKILELINNIENNMVNFDLLDDPDSSFFSNLRSYNLNNFISIKIFEKDSVPFHIGKFLDIFLFSLGRFEHVKEIFIANTQVFESKEIQFITDAIWNRDFLRNNDLSERDTKTCFLNIIDFYIKSQRRIIKLSKDHGI